MKAHYILLWPPCLVLVLGLHGGGCGGGGNGPSDPCEGVTCSFHGVCVVEDGSARCDCSPGYGARGLTCVEEADGDADGDVDGDVDSDVDSDGDADGDLEGDVDGDADVDGNEEYCQDNSALSFGDHDSVSLGVTNAYAGDAITVEFWIKLSEVPDNYTHIITNYDGGGWADGDFYIWVVPDTGQIRASFGSAVGGAHTQTSSRLPLDTWVHIAVVYNSSLSFPDSLRLYLDGTEDCEVFEDSGLAGTVLNTGSELFLGVSPSVIPDFYFMGTIDELRIWDSAHSASETLANMNIRLRGDESGLLGYWSFDEGEGQTTHDLAGDNDLTLGTSDSLGEDDPTWTDQVPNCE